jgi:G:T/U-mismatch repair DNA glycosylase
MNPPSRGFHTHAPGFWPEATDAEWNDFATLRASAPALHAVAHNGGESARARRHLQALCFEVHRLPSTSPANASWSFERKLAAWRQVFDACGVG